MALASALMLDVEPTCLSGCVTSSARRYAFRKTCGWLRNVATSSHTGSSAAHASSRPNSCLSPCRSAAKSLPCAHVATSFATSASALFSPVRGGSRRGAVAAASCPLDRFLSLRVLLPTSVRVRVPLRAVESLFDRPPCRAREGSVAALLFALLLLPVLSVLLVVLVLLVLLALLVLFFRRGGWWSRPWAASNEAVATLPVSDVDGAVEEAGLEEEEERCQQRKWQTLPT